MRFAVFVLICASVCAACGDDTPSSPSSTTDSRATERFDDIINVRESKFPKSGRAALRELMKQLYELRKRERPPVTGAEALEVSKAAARLPRERFNELMEQLLDEIKRTGREIKKARRVMLIGSDLHNTTQITALEALDAVVVVDEMDAGIRRAWGQVDTKLPPMEALARYYVLGRPVDKHNWNSDGRLEFIGEMAEQYKVNCIVSQIVRFCTYNGWDKFDLKKQMEKRGIPILDIDLEYGHPAGAQVKIRAEAFMEMLESRAN